MPQSFFDVFYQLFLLAVITFVTKISKDFWVNLSKPIEKPVESISSIKKIRSQFHFSLMLLIASIISFANVEIQILQGASVIAIVFAIILLWGAFDAVYFPLEKIVKKGAKDIANKDLKDKD